MYCEICDVLLNSPEQKISHQKGKNHQKKLSTRQRAEELLKKGSSFSRHCEICNVTLTSEITALDHFEGKSHRKRERALEKHNGCKLQRQCYDVIRHSGKPFAGENRCTLNSSISVNGRKFHSTRRASVIPDEGTPNIMNGYSTMDDFLIKDESFSEDSCNLVNGESTSGIKGENNQRSSSSSSIDENSSDEGQQQHHRKHVHDLFHTSSTEFARYSNGYETKTVKHEASAGLGPLTVGFGRPRSQEVQSPTRNTFQFYPQTLNQDTKRLEIENTFRGSNDGIGCQYFSSFHDTALQLPPSMLEGPPYNNSLELKNVRPEKSRSQPDSRNRTHSQQQRIGTSCPTTTIENGIDLLNFSNNNVSEVMNPCARFSSENGSRYPSSTQETLTRQQFSQILGSYGREDHINVSVHDKLNSYEADTLLSPFSPKASTYKSDLRARKSVGFVHDERNSPPQHIFSFSPPSSPPSVFGSSTCDGRAFEVQQRIMQFLATVNRPSRTLEISKALGFTTKKDINCHLYQMENLGIVYRTQDSKSPMWALNPPKRQNILDRGPGIIGEERKRSFNGYDEKPTRFASFSKSYSSGGLVGLGDSICSEGMQSVAREANSRPRAHSFSPPSSSSSQENCARYCQYCKVPLNSIAQTEEHFKSTKHRNRLAKMVFRDYPTFCDYCKVHLNSESQATEHFSSSRHEQTVAKSQKAPMREHKDLCTDFMLDPKSWTKSTPYSYQIELYTKAMETNSVCFLPTGTGKTLVSALVIANMLSVNPTRQVIFLVDRVLLVLQQSDYLKKELSQIVIQDPKRGRRAIRIGAVCGEMRKLEHGAKIYEHDLLVITADCYRNHLNNGTLRFEDVSLVVLDEAHHCNKEHPYNVIIKKCYLESQRHRPKILGLTASPAGEINLDRTVKKLQRLLLNLGGATLLTVTDNVPDLEEKTSRAKLVCLCTQYTSTESKLLDVLVEYATKCFNLAVRVSDLKDYKDIFQPPAGAVLSREDIYSILRVIDNLMMLSRSEGNALNALLHLQSVCDAVCTVQECGETVAIDGLLELMDDGTPHGFEWAETMGLPCSILRSCLEQLFLSGSRRNTVVSGIDSGVGELVEQLLKLDWVGSPDLNRPRPLALVLVKRRRTAHCLVKFLSSCSELVWRGVRSACIVGHGARSTDGGMSVNRQKETITHIRKGKYQVVVATSVAEEGLDLPVCQLVVQMDPPSSVTALVQIRGRARHKDAVFVAICRDEEQSRQIQDLLKREENMQIAAQTINGV